MGVRIASAISGDWDARVAAREAAGEVADALRGERADLVVVFACGAHLALAEDMLEAINEVLVPGALIGCGAGGVLAQGREVEDGSAVTVWGAALDEGEVSAFHADVTELSDGAHAVVGLADLEGASGLLLLPDPQTFPTDVVLEELGVRAPGVPVLGGLASARSAEGGALLFCGEHVHESGAVGVCLRGVEMLPCVSQGAAPMGPELTITAAEGHVIQELAGEPALVRLREVFSSLGEREQALVADGPLLGLVLDSGKPEYEQGDFLVRGLLGADPDTGAVAVGASVRAGQILRVHARDATSAHRDLRDALALRRQALGSQPPAGSLMFSCNGRGEAMFGRPDHDAELIATQFSGASCAGFFAAGEIGPVGGENHLHGFTATVAVFP